MPQGKPMMRDSSTLRKSDAFSEDTPSKQHARASLSPVAIVALSSLGAFVALALILNFTRYGSVGRYQFVGSASGQMVVRMDTTTGELSACFGFGLKPAQCFPWAHSNRDFKSSEN
jgi:hypothetical protein